MKKAFLKNKNHHYLAESYQRGFTDDNSHIWILTPENEIYNSNPSKTFKKHYFYIVKLPTGGGSLKVENSLSKIEGGYISALQKIERDQELNFEERAAVSMFIATMFNRTKIHRDSMREFFEELLPNKEIEGFMEGFDSHHSRSIMRIGINTALKIMSMHWTIFNTTRCKPFITSDNPLCMCSPSREKKYGINSFGATTGLRHGDAQMSFPLSKTHALLATWNVKFPKRVTASANQVDQINYRSIRGAKNYIASQRYLLDEIVQKIAERMGHNGQVTKKPGI